MATKKPAKKKTAKRKPKPKRAQLKKNRGQRGADKKPRRPGSGKKTSTNQRGLKHGLSSLPIWEWLSESKKSAYEAIQKERTIKNSRNIDELANELQRDSDRILSCILAVHARLAEVEKTALSDCEIEAAESQAHKRLHDLERALHRIRIVQASVVSRHGNFEGNADDDTLVAIVPTPGGNELLVMQPGETIADCCVINVSEHLEKYNRQKEKD